MVKKILLVMKDDINNSGLWYPNKLCSYIAFRTVYIIGMTYLEQYYDVIYQNVHSYKLLYSINVHFI